MSEDEEMPHKQKNKFFEPLVKSGFDFLQRSVSDFEKSPKFSMVNFAIAIGVRLHKGT